MSLIPDKIKDRLATKYLDWAESVPQTSRGFIQVLQETRKHQWETSKEAYERSRPPEGVEMDFLYFRLVEMFQLEDFESLKDGITRLIPGLKDDLLSYGFLANFERQAESIHGGSQMRLGYLFRDRKQRNIGMDPYRIMPELPEEVHFIVLDAHKLLPSVFAVTFDVHLSDEATRHLVRLQDRRYLPRLKLRKAVPWKLWEHGFSETDANMEMRRTILEWLAALRGRVELCLKPFINGHFMRSSSGKPARLPAIEVYGLKGVPEEVEPFYRWTKGARWWLDSLGFDFVFNTYSDGSLVFIRPRDENRLGLSSDFGQPAFRLVVLWEPYLRSADTGLHGGDEKTTVIHKTRYVLTALLPNVALLRFLDSVQTSIEKIRRVSYLTMKSGRRLGRYLKLSATIQRESMLLERISLDVGQQKQVLDHKMKGLETLEFIVNPADKKKRGDLRDDTNKTIEHRMSLLKSQLSLVRTSSTEFVTLQNMRAIYRLQWYVLVLAIIATVATIVSALATWPNVLELLRALGYVKTQ